MTFDAIAPFLPDWTLPWFAAGAAFAFLFRYRRLSLALALIPVVRLLIAPAVWSRLPTLPAWLVPILAVGFALYILHRLVALVFGREAAGHLTGSILFSGAVLLLRTSIAGIARLSSFLIRRARFGRASRARSP